MLKGRLGEQFLHIVEYLRHKREDDLACNRTSEAPRFAATKAVKYLRGWHGEVAEVDYALLLRSAGHEERDIQKALSGLGGQ